WPSDHKRSRRPPSAGLCLFCGGSSTSLSRMARPTGTQCAVKFFKENNERVRFLTEDEERFLAAEKVKKRGLEGHRQKRVGPSTALRAVPLPQKSRGGMSLHPHSLKLRGFPSPR